MSLAPGTRLGPYEITGQIGAGGMGEVWRATDTNLGRQVAIKILPDAFAHDPERLARFEREAKTLAALNHPNIAQIYGLEKTDSLRALVMELVEGPTLADRIAQGPIPVDEALPIARQIAEALEAAHEQGIIHRDLKPANVKLRPDGTVKVLDFGLAKALDSTPSAIDASQSPTITSPALTRMGVILGTAAYMSPEQAKGHQADKRSDVWAFGAVLYEMLTGQRAFKGEDMSDTLAIVLKGEPDWHALPGYVSPLVVTLIRHCLEKDRRRRIAACSTALFIFDESARMAAAVPAPRESRIRRAVEAGVVAVAAAAIAASVAWMLKPASVRLARFSIPLPMGEPFTSTGRHVVALSPDGGHIVYVANQRLYLRALDQLEAVALPGTDGGRSPFFSPDGQWVGFWQGKQLKKVSITGGAPVPLCVAQLQFGASWTADNTILYGQGPDGIWRVSGDGGTPQQVVKLEAEQFAHGPQLLPGGDAVLFTLARNRDWETAQIVVQSLETGRRHVILEEGTDARYVPTGHLVYALGNTLLAVPFDVGRLAVPGGAGSVPLVEGVGRAAAGIINPTGAAQFAVSDEGGLVYVPADAIERLLRTLVWVDRQGREEPLSAPPHPYFNPRLSPDGTRVAVTRDDEQDDIWIFDLARETLMKLTSGPAAEFSPIWTSNGEAVLFSSGQSASAGYRNLFRLAADGTGTTEQLTQGPAVHTPYAVTPDGTGLVFGERKPVAMAPRTNNVFAATDLMLLPLVGDRHPQPLLSSPYGESNAEISPDGRWLAYQSNESGRAEIFVVPFPNVKGRKWQVSTSGGVQPLWAHNGRELFYVSMDALMSVPVVTSGTFTPGTAAKLPLSGPYVFLNGPRMYDVSLDDQRFLMMKLSTATNDTATSARLILVQHWFEELKRRVPTR